MDKVEAKKLLKQFNCHVNRGYDCHYWEVCYADGSFQSFDVDNIDEKQMIRMAAMLHLAKTEAAINLILKGL